MEKEVIKGFGGRFFVSVVSFFFFRDREIFVGFGLFYLFFEIEELVLGSLVYRGLSFDCGCFCIGCIMCLFVYCSVRLIKMNF